MDKLILPARTWLRRLAVWPVLLLWFATAASAQEADPPGRVATLSHTVGSVVFAPEGEDEWIDLPLNRPLTRGDRVWTDRGARAELHMGATTLHLDSEANLAFFELDDAAAQLSLTQGSINVRVRDLAERENMEIDTPNLAVRAVQTGDYRVDVDPERGTTRVLVRSGQAVVFGESGESVRLHAGQQATFSGRDLEQVRGGLSAADDFDQWAGDLNRREDQSVAARYVPRHVVGYQQLDNYGSWNQDATYGTVWYPRVTVADWAPYRYGRWTWIRPWGWTWVDDAPWGFAPFHYGRWAMIGSRWAWVPTHLGTRPVYSPALVAFVGGGSGVSISINIGSGPGIGWYPLGPGEAWYPTYRTSQVYVTNVNRNIFLNNRNTTHVHVHRTRGDAFTAVRLEDFNRGRHVRDHWKAVRAQDFAHVPVTRELPRPDRERGFERAVGGGSSGRLVATPPPATAERSGGRFGVHAPGRATAPGLAAQPAGRAAPGLGAQAPGQERREVREERREDRRSDARPPFVRQDSGADERRRQQEAVQERSQREHFMRQQQDRAKHEQERAQREQAVRQQQERAQREQEKAQQRTEREQRAARFAPPQPQPQHAQPQPQQQAQPPAVPPGERRGFGPRQQQAEEQRGTAPREGRGHGRPQRGDDDEPRRGPPGLSRHSG